MKRLVDLTVDEVKQILTDIFNAKKVSDVIFDSDNDEITCNIYTEWGDDAEVICDEITVRNPFNYSDYVFVVNFPTNDDDVRKLRQFCYAKGVGGEMIDWLIFENPYLEK
jgi:hypothetical protein